MGYRDLVASGVHLWMAYNVNGGESGVLSIRGLQTMLHRLGRRAAVMPCSPHRFRRTFALWCLRDDVELHNLRMLMGHNSLAVLQRYLALGGRI
jgi:site-specific recombinase XerD